MMAHATFPMVLLLLLLLLLMLRGADAQDPPRENSCEEDSGPNGITQCLNGQPLYDDVQWAVCLSSSYLAARGLTCMEGGDRDFCWLQCQLEQFNKGSGTVDDLCKCTFQESNTYNVDYDASLPTWCHSPDGTSCNWYRQCLEAKYPCGDGDTGYALSYAEKFCELYVTRFDSFSARGQQWIDATRKCLQVALVPLLRPWQTPTCGEIKQIAFDSHSPCYLNPGSGAPSICELGCQQWAQVFWTIKGGFTQVFVEALKGTVEVILGCTTSWTWLQDGCPSVMLRLTLTLTQLRGKRQSEELDDEMAADLTNQISQRLNWNTDVLDWYAFARSTGDSDNMEVNIMLGDKVALDLTQSGTTGDADLENVVSAFEDAVEDGSLNDLMVDGETVTLSTLSACEDSDCGGLGNSGNGGGGDNAAPGGIHGQAAGGVNWLLLVLVEAFLYPIVFRL